jgi:hypothetical protein
MKATTRRVIGWETYEATGGGYIPMERWGKDHWSTFAYLETCAVDQKGIVDNRRMRCHARVHREFCAQATFGMQDGSKYPTRLKDGELEKHDDWSCFEDMVAAGLVRAQWRVKRSGEFFDCNEAKVELTPFGQQIAAQLRQYKAGGGNYHDFVPTLEAETVTSGEG